MPNRRHGMRGTPTYKTWRGMKLRCNNPGNASYKNYGAKGIGYDPRWEAFQAFLDDMGVRPKGMTLDRIDRSKGYTPDNCQWAMYKHQSQDRSITRWIEHDGQRLCLSDWAAETGLKLTTLKYRLDKGWSVERALTTPADQRKASRSA